MDVAKYFDWRNIQAAYTFGHAIDYVGGELFVPKSIAELDGLSLLQLRCLYLYLQSPVIVRPPLALCRALANTDLPIPLPEYHQPWPILGIIWPPEIGVLITLTWTPDPGRVWVFSTQGKQFLHSHFCGPGTIDTHIADVPLTGLTEEEEATSRHVVRMALNLGLLLTHKSYRLTRLPDHVRRNRRHKDPDARLRAQRYAQTVLFRDLDMFLTWEDKRPKVESISTCAKFPPQFRRGHWKRVAYGPGHSLRKLDWIEPYWTGDPADRQPVVTEVR